MNVIDIVFLILTLVSLIIGCIKGLSGLVYGFMAFVLSFAAMIFLTPILSTAIYEQGSASSIQESVTASLNNKSEYFALPMYLNEDSKVVFEDVNTGEITYLSDIAADELGFPKFLSSIADKFVIKLANPTSEPSEAIPLSTALAPRLTLIILQGIIGLTLFILVLIICAISHKLLDNAIEDHALRMVDRYVGLATAACLYIMFVLAVLAIVARYFDTSSFSEKINSSLIVKQLYEHNFMRKYF